MREVRITKISSDDSREIQRSKKEGGQVLPFQDCVRNWGGEPLGRLELGRKEKEVLRNERRIGGGEQGKPCSAHRKSF